YTGDDGTACAPCPAGTFKPTTGTGVCISCETDSYSESVAAKNESTCVACPSYTRSDKGSASAQNGSAACTFCDADTYSTAVGAVGPGVCGECPEHTRADAGSGLLTDCTCRAGYTGPDGTACSPCSPGTFKTETGTGVCTDCMADTYSITSGAGVVKNCTCRAGYTGDDGTECGRCGQGTFKPETGAAECTPCAAGSFSTAYIGPDGAACTPCDPGTYKANNGTGVCTPCPADSFSPTPALASPAGCRACP
ncbi:hypothetical protein T484DRAFT_1572808, partial [Baffinella frigidus]